MLPDSVSAPVDFVKLQASPRADPCCRLPLVVAFKGQEKGNVPERSLAFAYSGLTKYATVQYFAYIAENRARRSMSLRRSSS